MPLEHGDWVGVLSCPGLRVVCKMKLGALITERKKNKLYQNRYFITDSPFLAIFSLYSVPEAFFFGFHPLAIRLNICCARR